MDICVMGVGYVGLVTGAVFADLGNDVICVDTDEKKINNLNEGIMPIYEPGLEEMVRRNSRDGRLRFTTDFSNGVNNSKVIFIAVGTPSLPNGESDLSQVKAAAEAIAESIDDYKVIVNKSTVPVGTGNFVKEIVEKNKKTDVTFDVVSNPEFLREGSAILDTLHPDRIVIGVPDRSVATVLLELYAPLERPMLITDVNSAEMIKYASNAFLASKISFVNSIANICEKCGADVQQVVKGMGCDSRIGSRFLQPGLGYGGSCFPKDTQALLHIAKRYGYDFEILAAVERENSRRVLHFLGLIEDVLGGFKGKTVGVLGLAFKPNTDDLREAKSLEVLEHLKAKGTEVRAYDPIATENAKALFPNVTYCESSYEAAIGAHALMVVTEWNEFKLLNLERIRNLMHTPIIFDGRNIYDRKRMKKLGFDYYSIGVPWKIGH